MTVVLTGATRGIGLAAAEELGRRGVELALVGRDPERGRAAAELAASAGAKGVREYVADMAQLAAVRDVAQRIRADHDRIDVLANNAGAMFTSRRTTPDGFEQTFAVNHLAPFLLTALLLDRLAGGRVVTTASDAHRQGRLDLSDLQSERGRFRPFAVYGTSKLCNVLFTRELQRRHGDVTAICFHPGVIRTGFGKNDGMLARLGLTLAGPFLKPPSVGAGLLVRLALDPAAGDWGGCYVEKAGPVTPSPQARDDELAAALWERSAQLTGLVGSG